MSTLTLPTLNKTQMAHAVRLQTKGYTFTEIAAMINRPRDLVVKAIYYDQVRI